jgi:hypothetical protein
LSGTLGSEKLSMKCIITKGDPASVTLITYAHLSQKKNDLASIAAEIHIIGFYYLGRLMPMKFTI